ncbi:MAG: hypothetical protein ACKPEA_07490, partial [Planctomycetota bacterium]
MPADALNWRHSPVEAMARWPDDAPLAALVSGDDGPWSRWSVLAVPGPWRAMPSGSTAARATEWLRELARESRGEGALPGDGGWIVQLGYELGAAYEPATGTAALEHDAWPLAQAAPIEAAAVHDARSGRWHRVGGASAHWPAIEAAMAT